MGETAPLKAVHKFSHAGSSICPATVITESALRLSILSLTDTLLTESVITFPCYG